MSTHGGSRRPAQLSCFDPKRGLVAVLALFLVLTLLPAVAPSSAYGQAEPQVLGKTIGEWSAAWWQWATPIPTPSNPVLDTSGEFAGINQRGPVWFLAGSFFNAGPVIRTVTVPAGKSIFFPIVNTGWVKFPLDKDTESSIRESLNGSISPLGGDLVSTLDGVPTVFDHRTPTVRTQSPVFPFKNVPQDNILGAPIPAGSIGFSDGFWVMLPPLTPGSHVLKFQKDTVLDVTYNLTVLPHHH